MILVIGGFAQGKLNYVKSKYVNAEVFDEKNLSGDLSLLTKTEDVVIINHLHLLIRMRFEAGMAKEEIKKEMNLLLELFPNGIFISDEIGCGIVPMDAMDRIYREETGRIVTAFAQKAEKVVRITCGLEQQLK